MPRAKPKAKAKPPPPQRKPIQRIFAWSFSRWNVYDTCPRQARYKFVDRLPDARQDSSPALIRGRDVHVAAEGYLRYGGRLPDVLKRLQPYYTKLRKEHEFLSTELEVGINDQWEETLYYASARNRDEPGWNGYTWLRLKVDALVAADRRLRLVDHKTGSVYATSRIQMDLYATAGLALYDVDEVDVELAYVDQGDVKKETYAAREFDNLRDEWNARVAPMMADDVFAPTPGSHCHWCAYSKDKGGPCEFSG